MACAEVKTDVYKTIRTKRPDDCVLEKIWEASSRLEIYTSWSIYEVYIYIYIYIYNVKRVCTFIQFCLVFHPQHDYVR